MAEYPCHVLRNTKSIGGGWAGLDKGKIQVTPCRRIKYRRRGIL